MNLGKKNRTQSYCYAMIFVYGDQVSKVIEFESEKEIESRNEALENYFVLENQEVYLKTGSERLSTRGVTAIRMEVREKNETSLLELPESPIVAQLVDLPEEQGQEVSAGVATNTEPAFHLEELKEIRLEAGLTQKELAALSGINSRKLSRFERGQVEATQEELQMLQDIFDPLLIKKSNEDEREQVVPQEVAMPVDTPRKEVKPVTEDSVQFKEQEEEDVSEKKQGTGVRSRLIPVLGVKSAKKQSKKKEKKQRKQNQIPRGKRSISNFWRIGLWTGIFILGTSGLMAFAQASTARSLSVKAEAGVAQIQDQLENPVEVEDLSLKINSYGTNFLTVYMNSDPTESQQIAQREQLLGMYFRESHTVQTSSMYKRTLLHSQLYALEETKDGYAATYYVQYTVEPNERAVESNGRDDGQGSDSDHEDVQLFEQLITLRIVEQEGVFALEEMPSFSAAPNEKGLIAFVENPMASEQTMSFDDAEPIEQFMDQFLTNYAQNSLEDMQYLMKEPQSLNGEFVYESSDNQIYEQEDGSYIVKSVALFELKDTDIRHEERMTLRISTREDKYFVEELRHTFAMD